MLFFGGAGGSKGLLKDGHRWCMPCSYQVHGKGRHGGQHPEFGTTARPNNRCPADCPGCGYIASAGQDTHVTVLHLAAKGNQLDVLKALIAADSNIDAEGPVSGGVMGPAHACDTAAWNRHRAARNPGQGATGQSRNASHVTWSYAAAAAATLSIRDRGYVLFIAVCTSQRYETPIVVAAVRGHWEVVQELRAAGAKPISVRSRMQRA
jgi:hypothetical protein